MHLFADIIDDLLREVLEKLLSRPFDIETTRGKEKGKTSEINGILLELKNPRARISRTETRGKPFSAIGELFWYLSGSDKLNFIKHYIPQYENESEDKRTIYGAYGPRLFGGTLKWLNGLTKSNQIENVINLLKEKPNSRRAVVQVFSPKDLKKYRREIPCTCTFQFLVRNEKLTMIVNMRSNDAYLGLPHDIFAFTMIQEIVAKSLKRELGS